MITNYEQFCLLCGSPACDTHHCLKGVSKRHLAEEDNLTIPVCRRCHDEIHKGYKALNVAVEIIGQLYWEREYLINRQILPFDDSHDEISEEAREAFRSRYSRSYL